jgi:hypothetical protein
VRPSTLPAPAPQDTEALLCRASGHASYAELLASLQPREGGAQCSNVWTAGTIAYRCRTCQTNPTSAVCVQCFKAGGHEAHDWVQYRSGSGEPGVWGWGKPAAARVQCARAAATRGQWKRCSPVEAAAAHALGSVRCSAALPPRRLLRLRRPLVMGRPG